jgi:hypothetical protein
MGGSSPAQTSTMQQLPKEAKPFYKDIMNRASRASRKPFSDYGGKRLAKYNPDELRFQGGIRGLYDQGARPEMAQARGALTKAGDYASNVPMWGREAYQHYSSPFFEDVIDVQKGRISDDWNRQINQGGANSVSSGAFGGSGQAMQQFLGQQGKQRALAEAETMGRQQAWDSSMSAFQADRQAQSGAATLQTQIASQLQSLGQTQQAQAIERLNALEKMGAGRRELEQEAMNIAYQNFLDKEAYERKMLNWFGGIMHGVPLTANQMVEATPASSGTAAQVIGGISSGLGALGQGISAFG